MLCFSSRLLFPGSSSLECKHGHRECGKSLISFLTLVTSSAEKKVENILVACELRAGKKKRIKVQSNCTCKYTYLASGE